jgi:hypothetical protein
MMSYEFCAITADLGEPEKLAFRAVYYQAFADPGSPRPAPLLTGVPKRTATAAHRLLAEWQRQGWHLAHSTLVGDPPGNPTLQALFWRSVPPLSRFSAPG